MRKNPVAVIAMAMTAIPVVKATLFIFLSFLKELILSGGHYRTRTCDLFDVNEARYHCAKCPFRLYLSILSLKNNSPAISGGEAKNKTSVKINP